MRLIIALAIASLLAACSREVKTRKHPDTTPPRQVVEPELPPPDGPLPPPISGGTLMLTADFRTAVAADVDRDRITLVDLQTLRFRAELTLENGAEPTRAVEDPAGRIHIILRGPGEVATISGDRISERRAVCPGPRGIAYDAVHARLLISCLNGQVMSLLPGGGGPAVEVFRFAPDLRDIVVEGETIWISRFRSAEVIQIDAGTVTAVHRFPTAVDRAGAIFSPNTAWRMVAHPQGGVAVLHQRSRLGVLDIGFQSQNSGGWGGAGSVDPPSCDSLVLHSTVGRIDRDGTIESGPALAQAVLAVDLAFSRDGARYVVAAPGSAGLGFDTIAYRTAVEPAGTLSLDGGVAGGGANGGFAECATILETPAVGGETVSVVTDADGWTIAQSREPPQLSFADGRAVSLPGGARRDLGHELFHRRQGVTIACASCHPEGGDDGHVWRLGNPAPRRTQSLRGGVLETAPLHWDGALSDFNELVREVMVARMQAQRPSYAEVLAFQRWINSIPELPKYDLGDPQSIERGKAIFESEEVGCLACHSGEKLTNNTTVDVGTGGPLQVPTLRGLYARAPFLHDGCAGRLEDRFARCDSRDAHGKTTQLTQSEVADLVAYLESL